MPAANPRMQERLEHAELKFDPDQEIPHNVLSMYLMPRDSSAAYYIVLFAVGLTSIILSFIAACEM